MPSTPFDTLLALQLDTRKQKTYDQVIDAHPLTAWMRAGKRIEPWEEGGENIEFNLQVDLNDTFAARDYKTQLQFAEQNPIITAEIPRRFINGSMTWYEAQEESNRGKFKIRDFVDTLIGNAQAAAADALALEMWQGGTGEHLHGIPLIVDHARTYAGITTEPTTTPANNYWCAKDTDAGHTSIVVTHPNGNTVTYGPYHTSEALVREGGTDGGIRKLYNDCCLNGGTGGPDFAITSETLYNRLAVLVGAERIVHNEKMAQIGYPENFMYRKATVVWDRNCGAAAGTPDATTFYFLNSEYLKLKPYIEYAKGFKSTATFTQYANGVWAKARLMQWCGNLICYKPQRCGRLTNKTA